MLLDGSARLADLGALPSALLHDLFWLADGEVRPSPYWRPMVVLSYYLDQAVGGGAPWAFHLTNLVLLTVLGAWSATRMDGAGRRLAVLLLVVGHPMQSEVALNVTARTDLMAALFGSFAVASAALPGAMWTAFALGSKEVAVVVPLLAALQARAEGDRRPARWAPHLVVLGIWTALRAVLVSGWGLHPEDRGLPDLQSVLMAPSRVLFYLGRLLWPADPVAARMPPEPDVALLVLGWGVLALAALYGLRGLGGVQRDRPGARALSAATATVVLPLLPVSGLLASPVRYAEGYLCWPIVGMARGLAGVLPPVATLALALPCMALSALRVPDWRDEVTLWTAARAAYPDDPLVAGKYGRALREHDPDEAFRALVQALGGETDARRRREIHAHVAQIHLDQGRWREAVPHLRASALPDDVELSWPLLARCQVEAGERLPPDPMAPPLVEVCAEALRRYPEDPDLWNAVGVDAVHRKDLDAAEAAFRRAMALAPERADLRANLERLGALQRR